MIPIYQLNAAGLETREQVLARSMNKLPQPVYSLSSQTTVKELIDHVRSDIITIIFDPYFWYSATSWDLWLKSLARWGTGNIINVPLGNQDPKWSVGESPPLYMTLRGVEEADLYKGEHRWRIEKLERANSLCVATVSVDMMLQSPQDLYVADLPQFWVDNNSDVRIFCQGWLHSFGAIQSAECRYDLLALCSWDGLVLELGCGKGFMAQSCKKQHTAVTWIGLDLNESFLQYATKNMDLAVVTNSDIDIPLRNACFDRIVCADFLEHLCDPLKLLTQLRQLIKPDGLLIASVPNIGHWMVVEDLLHGRWDLTPSGIMCVTHLRFGTRKTWEDMLCQAGWKILHIQADRLEMPPSWRDAMIDMVTRPDYDNLESITFKIVARLAD